MATVAATIATASGFAAVRPINSEMSVEDLGVVVEARGVNVNHLIRDPVSKHMHLVSALEARNAAPFQIFDLDLETGAYHFAQGSMGRAGAFFVHSNGKLYIDTTRPPELIEYDFASGRSHVCGRLTSDYYHGGGKVAEAPDGTLYIAMYGGHVATYDPTTGDIKDLGLVGALNNTYIYSMALARDYAYCGMAGHGGRWILAVYDRRTGRSKEFFTDQSKGTKHVYRAPDGAIYYGRVGPRHTWYLLKDGAPVEAKSKPDGLQRQTHFDWQEGLHYALKDASKAGLEIDVSDMPPTNWNGGTVTVRWRAKGEDVWRTVAARGADLKPNAIKRMEALPDGRLVGISGFYGMVFTYDPVSRSSEPLGPSPCSAYAIAVSQGKVYVSGYPTAFAEYDPARRWNRTRTHKGSTRNDLNPRLFTFGGKRNVCMAVDAAGRIWLGGRHSRHSSGGSVSVYDPDTLAHHTMRDEFAHSPIRDVIPTDGGTRITVSAQVGDRAQLTVIETATREIVRRVDLPERLGAGGCLFEAAPGCVVMVGRAPESPTGGGEKRERGVVVVVDTIAGRIVRDHVFDGRPYAGPMEYDMKSHDRCLPKGPDGCGWLFVDDALSRVHPDGRLEAVKTMADSRGRLLWLGEDLYIYNGGHESYGVMTHLFRLRNVFE